MINVTQLYEKDSKVPFTMNFMQVPSPIDRLHGVNQTMTSVYSTDCGPNSSPDDGQVDSKDD